MEKVETFDEYQQFARSTAIYPKEPYGWLYPVLGLAGEAGEVAEKYKKIIRENKLPMTEQTKTEILAEIGDLTWYIANLCCELNVTFSEVATMNIAKLKSRQERGKLTGDGDNR